MATAWPHRAQAVTKARSVDAASLRPAALGIDRQNLAKSATGVGSVPLPEALGLVLASRLRSELWCRLAKGLTNLRRELEHGTTPFAFSCGAQCGAPIP